MIGKRDLKLAIEELFEENAKVFEVLDILIAVRKIRMQKHSIEGKIVLLGTYLENSDKIYEFIEDTGLGEVFRNKNITNLVDYVFWC